MRRRARRHRALVILGAWSLAIILAVGAFGVRAWISSSSERARTTERNRSEEIPALIARELAMLSSPLAADVSLIEQCLSRPWPGNVRELLTELRTAAYAARAGRQSRQGTPPPGSGGYPVRQRHARRSNLATGPSAPATGALSSESATELDRETPAKALADHGRSPTRADKALGLKNRFVLLRLLKKHGLSVADDNGPDP